jgi:hypothetical protein
LTPQLDDLARGFAGDVTDLLNRTVAHGVRLSAVLYGKDRCIVGCGITKRHLTPQTIACTLGAGKPTGHLLVVYTLQMDDEATYLMVTKSEIGFYADDTRKGMVFHYDYARNQGNEYPAAHVQVGGHCERSSRSVPAPQADLRPSGICTSPSAAGASGRRSRRSSRR